MSYHEIIILPSCYSSRFLNPYVKKSSSNMSKMKDWTKVFLCVCETVRVLLGLRMSVKSSLCEHQNIYRSATIQLNNIERLARLHSK